MRHLLFLVAFSIACVLAVQAQTVDTAILGTVVDPAGAPVAGATVTILLPTTGLSRVVTTSPAGTYEARYLIPGEYVVETGPPGFRRECLAAGLTGHNKADFSARASFGK